MRRRSDDHHYIFTRSDAAVAMDDADTEQRPSFPGFRHVPRDLHFRHVGIMLERERNDRFAVLAAATDAGESHDRADVGTAARELRSFGGGVERLALQTDGRGHAANVLPPSRMRERLVVL